MQFDVKQSDGDLEWIVVDVDVGFWRIAYSQNVILWDNLS